MPNRPILAFFDRVWRFLAEERFVLVFESGNHPPFDVIAAKLVILLAIMSLPEARG